jgi:hypothetical protein
MRRAFVLLLSIGAALALGGAASADQTYSDATGDAGAATDLASMTVRNDLAGLITIQITTASPIVPNHVFVLGIDSDKNSATGDDGDDYWFYGGPILGTGFFKWNGSGYSEVSPPSFRAGTTSASTAVFSISRADLGNTNGFRFWVATASLDQGSAGYQLKFWDFAPEAGTFTYDLAYPQCANGRDDDGDGKVDAQDLGCSGQTDDNESDDPVSIRLATATVSPAHPRAGSIVTVTTATTRVETNQPLDGGTVSCSARIVGGKAVRGSGSVVAGKAQCRLKVPASAKGKAVRGALAVTYQTASASAPFSFKVAK